MPKTIGDVCREANQLTNVADYGDAKASGSCSAT